MSDESNTEDPSIEAAAEAEAEERRKAKECETPKKQESLRRRPSDKGRGLSLARPHKKSN